MGKPIIHLICFAGPTVDFPKFSVFYETRKTSWHSSHCLFEFIFIGLSRVTIVFSYCPQIAKASLQYRPCTLQHYTRVSCMRKTLVKHSCKNIHAKIHEKIHANQENLLVKLYTQIVIICMYSVYLSSYIVGWASAVVLVRVASIC